MRIGFPRSYFYYTYQPFLKEFSKKMGICTEMGRPTDSEILKKGVEACVDEACLPVKVLCGQVEVLAESCDKIVLPRIMKTEFGESICPKVAGAADLIRTEAVRDKLIFTEPLYLDRQEKLKRSLWKECRKLGVKKKVFLDSFYRGVQAQRREHQGMNESAYTYKVFLAGHCYNLYDTFVNMDLLRKLHAMDIGVVTQEQVPRRYKERALEYSDLMKRPYWSFFVNNYTAFQKLKHTGIHGIIYVSSFSCGTDAFTIEMLKHNIGSAPMLVLKLDEQRGEAGFDTRLEAFADVLKGGKHL